MRLNLIDRIESLESGQTISAIKCLSMAEPYLKDHFPSFPVLPGVLMLESLYQAAVWLVLESDGFKHSLVLLKEAKNVKYADFVGAGETLRIKCDVFKRDDTRVTVKAEGRLDDRVAVSGRLVLEPFRLADRYPASAPLDVYVQRHLRRKFRLLQLKKQTVSLG